MLRVLFLQYLLAFAYHNHKPSMDLTTLTAEELLEEYILKVAYVYIEQMDPLTQHQLIQLFNKVNRVPRLYEKLDD